MTDAQRQLILGTLTIVGWGAILGALFIFAAASEDQGLLDAASHLGDRDVRWWWSLLGVGAGCLWARYYMLAGRSR